MKKIKNILIIIIFIWVFLKLFQIGFQTEETSFIENKIEKIPYKEFDYGDYKNVKLLHSETGQIEELPLDVYLYGVLCSEMPVSFEIEALKAQAVAARTYTIYQIRNNAKHQEIGADICDNPLCCQAWMTKENRLARWDKDEADNNWIKIENAVNSTIGKVIMYNGEPIKAFFHSNSGGVTESSLNVWGGDIQYLQAVQTSGEENYSSYESEKRISKDDLIVKMRDNYEDFEINFDDEDCIKILNKTDTSRKGK